MSPPFQIKALGEIAIRCTDPAAMVRFYRDILGLPVLRGGEDEALTFFKIAAGYGGHTSVLALFGPGSGPLFEKPDGTVVTGGNSSLHHLALTVDYSAQEDAMAWFTQKNVPYRVQHFDWVGWRGVFVKDPEGNTVELGAYDASELSG